MELPSVDLPPESREDPRGSIGLALRELRSVRAALAFLLMACLGFTEGIGIVSLVAILRFAGFSPGGGGLDQFGGPIAAIVHVLGLEPGLGGALLVYVAVVACGSLLLRTQSVVCLGVQHDLAAALRERLHRAISGANWNLLSRSRGSTFTHLLTNEVDRAGAAVFHLLQLAATGLLAAVAIGFALRISAPMTGLVLGAALLMGFVLRRKTGQSRGAGRGLSDALEGLHASIGEHLAGMKTVKVHGADDRHREAVRLASRRVRSLYLRAMRTAADGKCWFDVGSVALLALAVYLAVERWKIPPPDLVLIVYLFARTLPRVSTLQQAYLGFVHQFPAFEAIRSMEERCLAAAEPHPQGREAIEFRREVRLEGVSFAYDASPVLRGIDLTIRAGEVTGFVGPSGAGKTTLADLVAGLLTPDSGRVLVDGLPLTADRMASWREKIGSVGQEPFLFHDTVRANLLWARGAATEVELWEALKLAGADGFVARLPRGLDAVVGDRGTRLSGGERQRLALARALLRRPALLILDEAASHLDRGNEEWILRAIEGLRGKMAVVFITHRLSSVRVADTIHVLEGGRIRESGGWEDLLGRDDGRFRALHGELGADPSLLRASSGSIRRLA